MYKAILVDDEPRIVNGLLEMVKWEDYGIEIVGQAGNGCEALKLMDSHTISIVVTDIHMPDMDGLALLRHIREQGHYAKVIILSGYDDFNYVKEAARLGIENYLLKPVVQEELSSTLLGVIDKLEQEHHQQSELRNSAVILRNNILNRWLTGGISRFNLTERAELLQLPLSSPCYVVCLFKVLFEEKHDPTFRELTNYALENICHELLTLSHPGVMTVIDSHGYVAALFHGQQHDCEEAILRELLASCIAACDSYLKCRVFATIGSRESDPQEVKTSYANASQFMEYRMIMPANSIASYEQVTRRPFIDNIRAMVDIEALQHSILSKDEQKACAWLDEAFQTISRTEQITPQYVQSMCAEILYRILNTLSQMKMDTSTVLGDPDLTPLLKAVSLDDIKAWLSSIVCKAFDNIRSAEDELSPITKRVLVYMENHYADNISLKTIAAAFHVNAAYLGQLVIQEKKDTFSNLLHIRRIEEAKRLLRTTSLSLQDIAEQVGYVNKTYFSTIFKKIADVHPTKYRLEHTEV